MNFPMLQTIEKRIRLELNSCFCNNSCGIVRIKRYNVFNKEVKDDGLEIVWTDCVVDNYSCFC